MLRVREEGWEDTSEERPHGGHAGADYPDVDLDGAPVAHFDVVPWI